MNGKTSTGGEFTALLNGVEVTEEQLKAGLAQIERKRKDAEPKRGLFSQGDIVVYVGDPVENPTDDLFRLVMSKDGDRADILHPRDGYLYRSVPAKWYVRAPSGTEVTFTRRNK